MNKIGVVLACGFTAAVLAGCGKNDAISQAEKRDEAKGIGAPGIAETKAIAEEAYIYGFPMIAAYKAMYEFNVDKASSQYKGPFNQIVNEAHVFTYKDTAVPFPNSDTPYSLVQMDLRVEPMVLCVPAVDKKRYYAVQLTDMYTFNYGYIGSRATGSGAGCYMVSGPNWKGEIPPGISKVFNSETQFSLAIFRTQLFNAADMDNVKKVQANYVAEPLSVFLKQSPPPPASPVEAPSFRRRCSVQDRLRDLSGFSTAIRTQVPEEKDLRARFKHRDWARQEIQI